MTKLHDDSIRDDFRDKLCISDVAKVKRDPNYTYKIVIYTFDHDPQRVQRYEEMGWDIVYSEQKVEDLRSSSPSGTGNDRKEKESMRLKPVTKKFKGLSGQHTGVMMRIHNDAKAKNELTKAAQDDAKLNHGKKVSKVGNEITVQDTEINLNKPESRPSTEE